MLQGHQKSGLAVHDNFGNASHRRSYHRSAAAHGFQVDNAEGLVKRRGRENGRVAVKHAKFFVRNRLLDPHHAVAGLLHLFDEVFALVGKFDGVGSSGAEHHLGALVDLRNGLDQLADALLAGNATHEQHVGAFRVHAPLGQNIFIESRRIKVRIDAVVYYLHPVFRHAVKFHHVPFHALAYSNHAVGSLIGRAFNPAAHGIAAISQLFCLPRAVGFQRVGGENQRTLQKTTGKHSTKVAIPSVAVNDIDIVEGCRPLEVDIQRLENFLETVVLRVQAQLPRKTNRTDIVLVNILVAKTAGLHMAELCQLLGQELDVNTCTAVNLRRELVSKNSSVHNSTANKMGLVSHQ